MGAYIHGVHFLYVCLFRLYGMPASLSTVINPRRACAARVTVRRLSVCLSVCLSVDAYSGTTGYEAAYELYKRVPPNLRGPE